MVKTNRPHIGIFGKTNVGKSSLINVLAGQDVALVSDEPGTTTDPVKKTMEILGIGPVVLVDTAGLDDESALGIQRIKKTHQVLDQVDLAILVFSGPLDGYDHGLMETCVSQRVPFFFVHNKSDLGRATEQIGGVDVVEFSCKNPNVQRVLDKIKRISAQKLIFPKCDFGRFCAPRRRSRSNYAH